MAEESKKYKLVLIDESTDPSKFDGFAELYTYWRDQMLGLPVTVSKDVTVCASYHAESAKNAVIDTTQLCRVCAYWRRGCMWPSQCGLTREDASGGLAEQGGDDGRDGLEEVGDGLLVPQSSSGTV